MWTTTTKPNDMVIINLDPKFTPYGGGITPKVFAFPSRCEPHIKLPEISSEAVLVTCRVQEIQDVFVLALCVDALKRMGVREVNCFMPFLPFARQDRVMVKGEPLSIRVLADIINGMGFASISIYDPHSDVAPALLNNCKVVSNESFVKKILQYKPQGGYWVVSPDAGAYKKIFGLCQSFGYKDKIVLCNKVRDVSSGEIIEVGCDVDDFYGKDLYIIDDICDGGGTFVLLANELRKRNCGEISLIVSHGIFSRGVRALNGIDRVYTTDSFKPFGDLPVPFVQLYNLQYLI